MAPLKVVTLLLTITSQLVSAAWIPRPLDETNILTRREEVAAEYDYIIVGGGTSGLTVGDRLSENGKYSVLNLEYGYYDTQVGMHPKRMFNITSQPCPELNNRNFSVGIGCVVGGSSIVNGQVFLRGTAEEYDAWEALGSPNSTWNWKGLLPYFRKGLALNPPNPDQAAEYNITYDKKYWGSGTTSKVQATFGQGALNGQMKVLYSAMRAMPGVDVPVDSGAGETGLYWYTISQDPGTYIRSSARTAHWNAFNRTNWDMIVGAKVNKILFDGDNAAGVEWISRNDTEVPASMVKARKEVILAAGAIHTPQVLMLSGIGPSALLKKAGIEVKVDLPGVGSNFQDHSYIPNIAFQWGKTPGVTTTASTSTVTVTSSAMPSGTPPTEREDDPDGEAEDDVRMGIAMRQLGGQSGPPNLATMIGLPIVSPERFEEIAAAFEAQDPTTHLPDSYTEEQVEGYRQQQKVWSKLMRSKGVVFLEMMMGRPGGSIQNLHCQSRGTVLIDPADPQGEMIVDYRAASNEIDVQVMVEMIRFMRRYMTTGELAAYEATEQSPGANVTSDADLGAWARGIIIPSVYHPVATAAKMPREWAGVVDEDLLVYGVKGLSIVDASIFPTIVGATTSMTVYAVAEKAADIIKLRTGQAVEPPPEV